MNRDALVSCLLGGALGDSLGLPAENMSASRIDRRWQEPLRHRFFGKRGMVSDDTEHAVMTLLSIRESGGEIDRFTKALARRLRWWLAGLPAGIGSATARSIAKLWFGANPARSGVWSAGNGPMMRAAVIGVEYGQDPERRESFTNASTRITHSDPRAAEAARLIAEAAALAAGGEQSEETILRTLGAKLESSEMKERFAVLHASLAAGEAVRVFADRIGRKEGFVSGFAPDSAAVALCAWLRHRQDFRATVEAVVRCGGDTDTVAFIAGSLAGVDCGVEGMPLDWVEGLRDYPLNAQALQRTETLRYPNWPGSLFRNSFFFAVVVGHIFRRFFPPY
ncbi:ADP-ribosylglycohydrolase family protein [Luteolibacter luteus]|uniref:ADP-ribosylglycohydrolase family protein n=1 Tax=Luteolibacter luteus TaxID=2728835 RepID=A0A858RH81_9BACT|nr:ADP-ribosylglycohydrolase family protein [Luteolibacter luteus]QJE96526.1 ADP-ribosylglycohydrolase family protein [Luteolibacter luteus]